MAAKSDWKRTSIRRQQLMEITVLIKRIALTMFCFFALGPMALAQVTNATITGVVSDPGGAAIAGAHVRIQNLSTNTSQSVQTSDSGIYTVGQLLPGTYSVATDKEGFRKSVETGIILTVGQTATLNISLQVGDVKETVTVSGSAELINTTTAEISQVVNQHAIKELPLNGRNPSSLVLLTTGVTNVLNTGGGMLQGETTFPNESGASAGGGRQGSAYYLLDGSPNMDTYLSLAAPFPNPDATQEFRVISNNFDARYGFAPNAVVSIQTKSGSNAFHGGAFEFLRNDALNARDYFSHNLDTLKQNQFGGYLGGPILKNKLFFFANYQATRASLAAGTNSIYTPTQAMLNGDFTAVPVPTDSSCSICGTKVDPATFNKAAYTIATTALPLGQDPATGLVNYVGPANKTRYDEGTGRFDYVINDKQSLFLRSFTQYFQQIGGAINGNLMAIVPGKLGKYYNEALGHNWTINSTSVNSLTAFWTQMVVNNSGVAKDINGNSVCMSKYINVNERPGHCYLEGFSVNNGFSANYYEPTSEIRTTEGLSDTFTKTMGNHTLSVGVDVKKQFAEENTDYPSTPIINFSNAYTGFAMADFLFGHVNTFEQGAGEIASVKGWQVGLFAQDQYRVKPNFTVTAGVRWDPNLPPASTGGRGSAFHPGQQSQKYPNAPVGMVFPGDPGVNSALMPTTYGYFQPRVGFSWQPSFLQHTSVRGGFGLFTGPLPYSSYNHVADIAPFSPTFILNANAATHNDISFDNPWATFQGGVSPFPPFASLAYKPPSDSTFQTPVNLGAVFSNNFRLGMTESWNLSIEQQFSRDVAMHLAYVASESYHQSVILNQNPGIYAQGGTRTTYASFGQILTDTSFATSPYQSLQVGLEKRFSHGFQIQSNFTWSKVIDLAPTGNISFSSGLPDPFDIRHNRGISDLNVPLISVSNFVYTTPSLRGQNFLVKNLLGEWEISGIYTLQTGKPFGIVGGANGSNNSGALQYGDRADVVPTVLPQVHQGSKQYWLNHYVAQGSFQPNALGTFGNSARNLFTAPPTNTADASIAKNWKFQEHYGLQFRWEMFNAFNHTSYNTPNNDPTSSNFGQITSRGPTPPRVMQGGLKFDF
jgi:hypothetical protein